MVMGVSISHPDKPLWPDEKPPVTKLELAQYYETVGDWMIEHLKGRPVRWCALPTASTATRTSSSATPHRARPICSEQVKVSGDREALPADRSRRGPGRGGPARRHRAAPWNCQPGEPDLPGRLVFDLDPAPDVKFAEVIKAPPSTSASGSRRWGCKTFCKTTGGKGLHVVTPLTSDPKSPDWDAAKTFAREICRQLAEDEPDRFVLNMAKKERGGRIFLDYLRNDRTATARGAAVDARPPGRHGVDAAQLVAGEGRPRSHEVHHPHARRRC